MVLRDSYGISLFKWELTPRSDSCSSAAYVFLVFGPHDSCARSLARLSFISECEVQNVDRVRVYIFDLSLLYEGSSCVHLLTFLLYSLWSPVFLLSRNSTFKMLSTSLSHVFLMCLTCLLFLTTAGQSAAIQSEARDTDCPNPIRIVRSVYWNRRNERDQLTPRPDFRQGRRRHEQERPSAVAYQ